MLYERYAKLVQPGEVLTRLELADRAGRKKTTTFISHLERAVQKGLLKKAEFTLGNNIGWGYALPGTMQELELEK